MIGTKWIFKNKMDEHGNITRNKARLVAQGYTQVLQSLGSNQSDYFWQLHVT